MLRYGLVLLVAASAIAAPSIEPISLTIYGENEVGPTRNNGRSSYFVLRIFDLIDDGSLSVNAMYAKDILKDLADNPDTRALAFGQSITVVGEVAPGYPGDACAASALIEAYNYGKPGSIRQALGNYIRRLASNIDLIVQLALEPNSVKYSSGARSGCQGGGRNYRFEDIWNINLANASPNSYGLINEEYCTAKRLFFAGDVRNNNLAAALSATATPGVRQVFNLVGEELFNLLRVIAAGGNPGQAASVAKSALIRAAGTVKV